MSNVCVQFIIQIFNNAGVFRCSDLVNVGSLDGTEPYYFYLRVPVGTTAMKRSVRTYDLLTSLTFDPLVQSIYSAYLNVFCHLS